MAKASGLAGISVIVLATAVIYQYFVHNIIFVMMGPGRQVQQVTEFPFKCRRIHDPALHACEDLWLDDRSRQLFLACSDIEGRGNWLPNMAQLNADKRPLNDRIIAMDIGSPKGDGFEFRTVKPSGYKAPHDNDRMYLLSVSGTTSAASNTIQLWLVNNRPSVDPATGKIADQYSWGSNSTIEVFETGPNASTMKHIRTFANPVIATPNNIAPAPGGGFYFTNDHGTHKTGLAHSASMYIGTGSVGYCSPADPPVCKHVASWFRFPNGLYFSQKDGLLYVPSSVDGEITVYSPSPLDPSDLTKVDKISTFYPLDNISEDADGDMFVAAFPDVNKMLAKSDPFKETPPSATLRIRRVQKTDSSGKEKVEYKVEKIIEDRDGSILPGTTTVVRDAKTGRLFMGGVMAPFMTVCDPA